MHRVAVWIGVASLAACGGGQPRLQAAGADNDEGHGELARASARFLTPEDSDDDLYTASGRAARTRDEGYGGDAYGGAAYASYVVPSWSYPPANRSSGRYTPVGGLSGAIEGVIAWRGAPPPRLTTACGAIDGPRIGADGGLAGVLVYIERVQVGRPLPSEGRPISVGGVVTKRGCALRPPVQIVTPLPAALTIDGDASRARLRITPPTGAPRPIELQEGGRIGLQLATGVTRIDADDGTLAAAWVLALDTPYYAITDDRGYFRLDELAPGSYEVTVWHPPAATASGGTVSYGAPAVVRRGVTVESIGTARLDVALGR